MTKKFKFQRCSKSFRIFFHSLWHLTNDLNSTRYFIDTLFSKVTSSVMLTGQLGYYVMINALSTVLKRIEWDTGHQIMI